MDVDEVAPDIFAELPEDLQGLFLEDVLEVMAEAAEGLDLPPQADDDDDMFGFREVMVGQEDALNHPDDGNDTEDEEPALSAADAPEALPSGGSGSSTDAAVIPDSVADLVAKCVVDSNGYVSCAVGRWAEWPAIGRITSWPSSQPLARRSVSIKCYVHPPGCTSPAKKRDAVTDEQLLWWLFQGALYHGVTVVGMKALQQRHKSCWAAACLLERSPFAGSPPTEGIEVHST